MTQRIAAFALIIGFLLSGCKKKTDGAGGNQPTAKASAGAAKGSPVAVATATPVPTPTQPAIDRNAMVIVYGYHRFVEKVRRPDTEITPAAFEAQMKELKDKNIPVISMQDFLAWKRGEKNIPPRAAIITLDDNWLTQYAVAWPILKKYGYPFTMFVYTEGVRPGGHFSGGGYMTWDQLAEMRDAGVDIQGHSATHQDLRKRYDAIAKKKLNEEEYAEWLKNETAGVKKTLEDRLGIRVNAFAVPYGKYDPNVQKAVMDAGYEALFTVYGQPLTFASPMHELGRYLIEANKPKVFVDAANFGGASAGSGPAVAQMDARAVNAQPAEGVSVNTATPMVKANLAPFGDIQQGSVVMRIGGVGRVPAKFNPQTKELSYQLTQQQVPRDKSVTVIIEAKVGEQKRSVSWTFKVGGAGGASPAQTPTTASTFSE